MPMLADRVAMVTGAGRGIGLATARAFAAEGARLVLTGLSEDDLKRRADEIGREFGVECMARAYDVRDADAAKACFRAVFDAFGRLDVLVNNAGILEDALIGMIDRESVERQFGTNVFGAIDHLQAAARLMMRARQGSIINVASIIGTQGNAGQAVYGATKAALIGLTRSAAKELGAHNIRVNAVAPGYIETDMVRHLPENVQRQRVDSIAMKRAGTPEDVARVILFLASDMSSYVTGQVIGVDGGMVI